MPAQTETSHSQQKLEPLGVLMVVLAIIYESASFAVFSWQCYVGEAWSGIAVLVIYFAITGALILFRDNLMSDIWKSGRHRSLKQLPHDIFLHSCAVIAFSILFPITIHEWLKPKPREQGE
jgi:hypothetical protein